MQPIHSLLKGLVVVEGEKHRKQVSSIIYNPSHFDLSPSLLASHHGAVYMALGNPSPVIAQRASAQNPAFGHGQLRSFTPIFNQKATEVRNILLSQLNESPTDVIKVNIPYYMSRATLDIIGLAGQHVVHDVTPALLIQIDPRRFRLRVQLPAVQER